MTTFARYPFSAVAGLDNAKRALLINITDPLLKGVIIAGPPGSGKSALAKSLRNLLPYVPFIQVPATASDSALTGGLDLEATLKTSTPAFSPGLLAQADGGILLVEEINLMERGALDLLMAALDSGIVRVEREGSSGAFPSRFLLVGTCDPAEGDIPAALLSRVGLFVVVGQPSSRERREVLSRATDFDRDPERFIRRWSKRTANIRSAIDHAKAGLNGVAISDQDLGRLCASAIELGVEGNRADFLAVRAARANAALEGRDAVEEEDLIEAIRLALVPKATQVPSVADQPAETGAETESEQKEADQTDFGEIEASGAIELIIKALDGAPMSEELNLSSISGTSRSSGRRRSAAKKAETADKQRGRYFRSTTVRASTASRVALDATLRAAAPYQKSRRAGINEKQVMINPHDLRYKEFKRKHGTLFIFAVDASGSMALNRMAEAKGAMIRLLEKAYLQRDSVALIAFRGRSADVLLSPTRSVELARRSIEALPAGGGTPLAAGLATALELARRARKQQKLSSTLIVFTDGRANVGLSASSSALGIADELRLLGAGLINEGINSVVIDTRPSFAATGDARRLCEIFRATYVHLPRANANRIENAIRLVTS